MDRRSLSITIGFILFMVFVGPFRVVGFLYNLGLFPKTTEEQVSMELKRGANVRTATCRDGSPDWDFVCDYEVQPRDLPPERHRVGIRTSLYRAIAQAVPLAVDGPVMTEAEKRQWQDEEQRKRTQELTKRTGEQMRARRVNVRTATITELRTIPRVDQYRAQEIQAAVRVGLVKKFDDLLKIEGIDGATLNAMRTRAYWE
jgi:DNA uptake protein ComE-like DNA-binding protein